MAMAVQQSSSSSPSSSSISIPIADPVLLEDIRQHTYDWAFGHGLVSVKKQPNASTGYVMHVPVALLPTPWPRSLFEQAEELAPDFNLLVHHLSRNKSFILDTLEGVPDEFTQQLLKIYKQVEQEGVKQPISLGLHRSDYMIHSGEDGKQQLQQVELNTISSSFSSLSMFTSQLHKYITTRFKLNYPVQSLPSNISQTAIPKAIAAAHKLFGDEQATTVLMVIQKGERNMWDQRWIEYHLWDSYGVPVKRRTLEEIEKEGTLDEQHNLIIGAQKVSVVYFRAGYTPNDYPSQLEWDARLLVERSRAIKCPSISYHLVGAKKVQQVIAADSILDKLITDQESVKRMKRCFTGLYSMSGPASQQMVDKAIQNYGDYVLKPQREGGGNNIYNEDLRTALQTMSENERGAYILMDRIRPAGVHTHIMREGQLVNTSAVSELGIFGCFISDNDRVIMNEVGGLLLRTKSSSQEDGGVAAGVAVLDSPFLT